MPAAPEFFTLQEAVAGRYSIVGELGRGGMGIAFHASTGSVADLTRHLDAAKRIGAEISLQLRGREAADRSLV